MCIKSSQRAKNIYCCDLNATFIITFWLNLFDFVGKRKKNDFVRQRKSHLDLFSQLELNANNVNDADFYNRMEICNEINSQLHLQYINFFLGLLFKFQFIGPNYLENYLCVYIACENILFKDVFLVMLILDDKMTFCIFQQYYQF